MGTAAGLGALGFWIFIGAVVVAGIWFDVRRRESQQETLRRVVESGQNIDTAMIDKLVKAGGEQSRTDRDLTVAGLIVVFIAPGLAILGWFLAKLQPELMSVMLGVSLLMGFIGVGLLVAGRVAERWYREDQG
jgi:ABC-type antimicrobial peptide transport system permease subunit